MDDNRKQRREKSAPRPSTGGPDLKTPDLGLVVTDATAALDIPSAMGHETGHPNIGRFFSREAIAEFCRQRLRAGKPSSMTPGVEPEAIISPMLKFVELESKSARRESSVLGWGTGDIDFKALHKMLPRMTVEEAKRVDEILDRISIEDIMAWDPLKPETSPF
ncbi:hypothetical protein LTS18_002701 [Coniosporium uncinatum]|uniref:Uncharacterized protein n=1 Tax=Coniosporium uncinatum TaxID=93489 RepID=A0ACC3DCY8_9PEZI|nr:hypothetical protein LTS18_002701 [Coniosporium uncinatum]